MPPRPLSFLVVLEDQPVLEVLLVLSHPGVQVFHETQWPHKVQAGLVVLGTHVVLKVLPVQLVLVAQWLLCFLEVPGYQLDPLNRDHLQNHKSVTIIQHIKEMSHTPSSKQFSLTMMTKYIPVGGYMKFVNCHHGRRKKPYLSKDIAPPPHINIPPRKLYQYCVKYVKHQPAQIQLHNTSIDIACLNYFWLGGQYNMCTAGLWRRRCLLSDFQFTV